MTSSLKYYHGIGSPVSRSGLLLIRSLGLDVDLKLIDMPSGEHCKPEFLKLNPLHQLPVLVDGDFVLAESRAILAYLVNKYKPGSSWYPNDPQARAVVDQRLYYDSSNVYSSLAQIVVGKISFHCSRF
jgi:glutathione S-transferase